MTRGPDHLEVRPATAADVRTFAAWRYPAPYDVYDVTDDPVDAVAYFLQPSVRCHVLVAGDEVRGFCTFGEDARVPGGDYTCDALDVGMGMRPDLTGRGLGRRHIDAVVRHAGSLAGGGPLRVTIAAGNDRALRAWRSAGFVETARFTAPRPVMGTDRFVVLLGRGRASFDRPGEGPDCTGPVAW